MSNPRVLHKDQDYLNYNSSNLEWAEEDSPEYQTYVQHVVVSTSSVNRF